MYKEIKPTEHFQIPIRSADAGLLLGNDFGEWSFLGKNYDLF